MGMPSGEQGVQRDAEDRVRRQLVERLVRSAFDNRAVGRDEPPPPALVELYGDNAEIPRNMPGRDTVGIPHVKEGRRLDTPA